jgi:hypothetical protein
MLTTTIQTKTYWTRQERERCHVRRKQQQRQRPPSSSSSLFLLVFLESASTSTRTARPASYKKCILPSHMMHACPSQPKPSTTERARDLFCWLQTAKLLFYLIYKIELHVSYVFWCACLCSSVCFFLAKSAPPKLFFLLSHAQLRRSYTYSTARDYPATNLCSFRTSSLSPTRSLAGFSNMFLDNQI